MQFDFLHKTYPKTVVFQKADGKLSVALSPNVIPSNEINTPTVYFEVKERPSTDIEGKQINGRYSSFASLVFSKVPQEIFNWELLVRLLQANKLTFTIPGFQQIFCRFILFLGFF